MRDTTPRQDNPAIKEHTERITIKDTPTTDLNTYLERLQDEAKTGQNKQAALATRLKIRAIEMTLTERQGAAA